MEEGGRRTESRTLPASVRFLKFLITASAGSWSVPMGKVIDMVYIAAGGNPHLLAISVRNKGE